MFITGPQVIKQVTGEQITAEALGGADAHMALSGVIHFVAEDDEQAILIAKKLLSFLPQNNPEDPPSSTPTTTSTPTPSCPTSSRSSDKQGYDVREVIGGVVDRGDFLEVQAGYAAEHRRRLRPDPRPVGRDRRQPAAWCSPACSTSTPRTRRAAFIRFCNAFNIPLVTFVDVPGFLPGRAQEHGGIIRHGAKLLFAYSAATVPKITVILRKSYGGAYLAMCSKDLGADRVFAWPTAEIAVMGAEGAAEIVFRRRSPTPRTRRRAGPS